MSSQEFFDRIEFPWADHGESPEQVISKLQQQLAAERELLEDEREKYRLARNSSDMGWQRAEDYKQQVQTLVDALKLAATLLLEVRQIHADPNDPNYNECDKEGEECQWCVESHKIDAALAKVEKP